MAKRNNMYQIRAGRVIVGILCFVATYLVFLRAADTGSLQQYGILFIFLFYGINRLFTAITLKN